MCLPGVRAAPPRCWTRCTTTTMTMTTTTSAPTEKRISARRRATSAPPVRRTSCPPSLCEQKTEEEAAGTVSQSELSDQTVQRPAPNPANLHTEISTSIIFKQYLRRASLKDWRFSNFLLYILLNLFFSPTYLVLCIYQLHSQFSSLTRGSHNHTHTHSQTRTCLSASQLH